MDFFNLGCCFGTLGCDPLVICIIRLANYSEHYLKSEKKKVGKSERVAPGEEGWGVRRVCFSLGVMALKGLEVTWKSLIRIDKIGQS